MGKMIWYNTVRELSKIKEVWEEIMSLFLTLDPARLNVTKMYELAQLTT